MSLSKLFKKETSQRCPTLDHTEWLVLKELATFFLSVDFPGSQLEALLRARAPLPESNTDEMTTSILTPFPAVSVSSPASESEVEADARTIRPPLVPLPADASTATSSSTREPSELDSEPESVSDFNESHSRSSESPPTTRTTVVDRSFEYSVIDGTDSSRPVVVDNFSHCTEDTTGRVTKSAAFSHSTIKGATINNHSWNGNVDCFTVTNSRTTVPHVMNNIYRY